MQLDREPSPTFQRLELEYGRPRALREWKDYHHADGAVLVDPWDPKEFAIIHSEAARREGNPMRGMPSNGEWLVTETGARLHTTGAFVADFGGWPNPRDPPKDALLRLTWVLKHYETKEAQASKAFAELKAHAQRRAKDGKRDPQVIEQLENLREEILALRIFVQEAKEEREPLLPARLRPPSAKEIAAQDRANRANAKFDRKLDDLEI